MLSHVLLVGTSPAYTALVRYRLASNLSIQVRRVGTGHEATDIIDKTTTLVVVSHTLPDSSGLELVASVRAGWGDIPILLMVRQDEPDAARAALAHGATDVLVAGRTDLDRVEWWIAQTCSRASTMAPPVEAPLSIALVGDSLAIRRTRSRIHRAQQSDTSVLLSAELGLEPEAWARCLHEGSSRAEAPFVAFDGAVLSDAAVATRLFGTADTPGACAEAQEGTLFVDNLTLLSETVQQQLAALVDTATIPAHAGREDAPFQARLVFGTRHDVDALTDRDMLTPDLRALLMPQFIRLPSLRERTEDLLLLAQQLLRDRVDPTEGGPISFSVSAMRRIMTYDWPGNYRELEAAIEQGLRTATGLEMTVADLFPDDVAETEADTNKQSTSPAHALPARSESTQSEDVEPDLSESTLSEERPIDDASEQDDLRKDAPSVGPQSLFDLPAFDGDALDEMPPPPSLTLNRTPLEQVAARAPDAIVPMDELQILAIEHALHVCGWDINQAARALGIAPVSVSHIASQRNSNGVTVH